MRDITLTINDNKITASDNFIGYQGEHNATILKFVLSDNLINPAYTYTANITLPDGITATATITDMSLTLTQTLTANAGIIQLQIVITEGNELVYKSGITNLTIKPSLAPTATIGNGSGITSVVVNDEGYLIVTLSDGKEINAGYVKGDKGEQGEPYELTDEETEQLISKMEQVVVTKLLEHEVEALEIPDGTTVISEYPFQNMPELRRISIPDSVVEIEQNAFKDDFRLATVGKLGSVKSIGDYAFSGCYSLTDIEFSETIKNIGRYAFEKCYCLQNDDGLNLPNCTSIGGYAFDGVGISGSFNLPNCTYIGGYAFRGCYKITDFNFDAVEQLSYNALAQCTGLKTLRLPSVQIIEELAFAQCTNLQSIYLGNTLKSWGGKNVISGCTSLTEVILEDGFNCSINLSAVSLDADILINILNALADRTGLSAGTLTINTVDLAKLTDEQKSVGTNKNWILKQG